MWRGLVERESPGSFLACVCGTLECIDYRFQFVFVDNNITILCAPGPSILLSSVSLGRYVDMFVSSHVRVNDPAQQVNTYTCTHTYTHAHTHAHVHIYICTHMYTYTQTYTHAHSHRHTDTHRHTHVRTRSHTRTHTHLHARTHTHTHTHTHTQLSTSRAFSHCRIIIAMQLSLVEDIEWQWSLVFWGICAWVYTFV